MRVLGDIDPRSTTRSNNVANPTRSSDPSEQFDHGERDISNIPLRLTDERYRVESDRLREDEARQETEAAHPSRAGASSSARATAVEEREVDDSGIGEAQLDLGSLSNELTQEHRQRAASEMFGSLGYAKQFPKRRAGAPWTLVLVLLMAPAGITAYGYLAMRENGVPVWRLPGVQTAIMLRRRLDAAQTKASADLQAARQRSDQLIATGRERWARWRR